jgi:class 3 adenylate cyclase
MSPEAQQLQAGIAALEGQRESLGNTAVNAAVAVLRQRLQALQDGAAEAAQALRQVTILFLDVVGSTTLTRRLDPEETSAVMDSLLARGTAIVEAHRGKVLQYAGDNLLAAFGADAASEDDAEHAVRCGLALLALGKAIGAQVQAEHGHGGFDVRIGIHTGGVLLGGGVDADGSIRGQAVNIAARMEQAAPAGALRISDDTHRLVRGLFDVDAQPPLHVKGLDEPVRSHLVLSARPRGFRAATRGIEGVDTRMIGRDADLAALRAAFERLLEPGARLQRVLVVAEAGVGKTRLLREFQHWTQTRAERFHLFQALATPQTQGQPYGLLRDLFVHRLQILDGDSMDVARRKLEDGLMPLLAADNDGAADAEAHVHLLGQLIGLDYRASRHIRDIGDDARQMRRRGFHAAALVLRRLVERGGGRPAVIQVDDLHWADDGSLDFIDHLATAAADLPVLLLALTRPTLFERRAGARAIDGAVEQRIELRPLDRAGSAQLADELLKRLRGDSAALRDLVIERADGNPFYMEELVKMLIDQGAIATTGAHWTIDADRMLTLKVPPTLTGVLQARLDGLPPRERRALRLASVVGLRFWDAALAHVDPAAAAELPALRRRELVDRSDDAAGDGLCEYAFRHQILHQVTYDTVLKRVKRHAHARAADWLAHHAGALGTSLLGAAAQHYERAGDDANAAEFYARAAEHQASLFAYDAALADTAHALRVAPPAAADLRWRLLAKRERVFDMLGRREAQAADIDALQSLADAMPNDARGNARRAEVAWRRADIADRSGDWPTAEREARRAQVLAEGADEEMLALVAIKRLVQVLAYRGDPAAGQALAEAALTRARALNSAVHESGLLNALTVCTDLLGDRIAGLHSSLQDLALCRAAGLRFHEAVALSNVGMSYVAFGAFEAARSHLQQALRLHRALGNRAIEGNTHAVLSELAWRERNGPLALSEARAALDIAVEVGARLHECDALWSLGNAQLTLGHFADAAAAFERSEALAREIAYAPLVLNALDGQVRVALARGDAARSEALAECLIAEAGSDSAAANPFSGACEHLIQVTLHSVWAGVDPPRADAWLSRAHIALMVEADRIHDAELRQSFLTRIDEHRAIVERCARKA